MKRLLKSLYVTATVATIVAGCSLIQKQTIAPGGAYSNDPFLLGVDQSIVGSKQTLDAFLVWLQQNDAVLMLNNKSVLIAGEKIRTNAPTWFTNVYNLRGAYLTARQEADPAAATAASNALVSAETQLSAQASSTTAITNNVKLP